jgi:hypothetical protein
MKDEVVFYEKRFSFATWINKEGVYIKEFPFLSFLKYKFFPWEIISKSHVRKYNPVWEYGGWGGKRYRWRIMHGRIDVAYNVWGDMGLQLELINGKRVLIGTRKPVEMEDVLRKLNKILT